MSPADDAAAPAAPALSFDDVSVVRGGRLIWSEGTFDVPSGGIIAVIGSSGVELDSDEVHTARDIGICLGDEREGTFLSGRASIPTVR